MIVTPESTVALSTLLWQEELAQATSNTATVAGCYRQARRELWGWSQHPLERPLQTMLNTWRERATRKDANTLITEQRKEHWAIIAALAQEKLVWSDGPWNSMLVVAVREEGYGLWHQQHGWIIPPGGAQ